MKKILIFVAVILILVVVGTLFYLRSSSGFRSIYFVPEDASVIVESNDPIGAWSTIVHSNAWEHYKSNSFFEELNAEIESYDSIVNSSKFFLKLVGRKAIMMSQHPIPSGGYDYIYIIDVGKIAGYKKPAKVLKSILGKEYEVTSRAYKAHKIVEIFDIEYGEYYFLCFAEGKLIFSFNPKLIEKSIDASEAMVIGRDLKYLQVKSKLGNDGLLSIYIAHKNFTKFMSSFSPDMRESLEKYTSDILYTGMYFDLTSEGLLTIEGYSSFGDEHDFNYLSLLDDGKQDLYAAPIIPQRIASLVKINFDDASEFFKTSMRQTGEEDFEEYVENIAKLEKKLKISLDKNLFSWMKDEIVMIQSQPSNLGRDNEFAVVLHASDSAKAAENLQILWKQIKRNTPVKIKSVIYKGFSIDYIAFPGIIKVLFGKALEKIEKPYFTVINDNVVLSNHPQTLKNIIDDYTTGNTFEKSLDYLNFSRHFEKSTSLYMYFEPPALYQNMRAFTSSESWAKLRKNKKHITCFSQGGMQLNQKDELMHFVLKAQYQQELDDWKKQFYNTTEILSLFQYTPVEEPVEQDIDEPVDTVPKILISDLDARNHEEYYENGDLKLSVEVKDGLKNGDLKFYHENGEIYIKGEYEDDEPTGKWKYYDEEGELIKTDKY